MAIPLLTAVMPVINKVIDLIPDPNARAKAKEQALTTLADYAHKEALEQVKLNQVEAQHKSVFVAGWRPFVGWVGGFGFLYAVLLAPFMEFIALLFGYTGAFPEVDTALLLTTLGGMLGMGGLRSFDKLNRVSTESLQKK